MEYALNSIKANWRLFVGYALCASVAVVVDLTTLYTLTEFGGLWYFYSAAIAFIFGVTTNFTLNKVFNFRDKSQRIAAQFSVFAIIAVFGLVANQLILYGLVEYFDVWYLTAKLIALVLIASFSFYGHKKFTFAIA